MIILFKYLVGYEIYLKNINDDVSTTKNGRQRIFFCYDRKQRNPTMFQYIHAEVYARKACTNPKNKTKYCIDDIIGEVIRDPAHSEAIANPQPPRYIISSEAGLKGHANENKRKRSQLSR